MSNNSSQYICVGTKRISIDDEEYGEDACISLFRLRKLKQRSSSSSPSAAAIEGRDWRSPSPRESFDGNRTVDDCLHLMATDGELTFYKSIAAKDIKHMTSTTSAEELLDQVESILLHRNRTIDEIFQVNYKMIGGQVFGGTQDTMNTTCLKVSIRKTLANQIVRPIWEGNLIPISHANYDSLPIFARHALPNSASNQYETASSLAFSIILGDTITKLQKDITALREENEQLRINTGRWKGTSTKLSNQWQSEKSELTERFLTLFNQHKARHVETKKELDELKGKQRYEKEGSSLKQPHSAHKDRPEMRPDDEDEHDYVTYDDDYVNRMAAGGVMPQKKRRKNSTTGATEVQNVKDMFSSDEEEDKP